MEPTTLHQAGQRSQHTTNELFRPILTMSAYNIRYYRILAVGQLSGSMLSSAWQLGLSGPDCSGTDLGSNVLPSCEQNMSVDVDLAKPPSRSCGKASTSSVGIPDSVPDLGTPEIPPPPNPPHPIK